MHNHPTAVLDGPAEATSASTPDARARDQWIARCTDDAAKALTTGNADMLPVLPALMFYPKSELCPDCEGTGYTWMGEEFTLCYCGDDATPAYDFPRITKGEVIATIEMSRRNRNEADVWVPCQHCDIGPIKYGPYNRYFHEDLIRVPWVSDCTTCNDTGWAFSRHIPAEDAWAW